MGLVDSRPPVDKPLVRTTDQKVGSSNLSGRTEEAASSASGGDDAARQFWASDGGTVVYPLGEAIA